MHASPKILEELALHPALWIASLLLLASGSALGWGTPLIPWFLLLLAPWILHKKWLHLLLSLCLMCAMYTYTTISLPSSLPTESLKGVGVFSFSEIRKEESPFGRSLVYIGNAAYFKSGSHAPLRNIPCRIYTQEKKKIFGIPPIFSNYLIEGTLIPKKKGLFLFKPNTSHWHPIKNTVSLAELRYQWKMHVEKSLAKHFSKSPVLSFFSSLTIGIGGDREIAHQFRALGLSHILAISGFHFALFSTLLLFFLRILFKESIALAISLILLAAYAFFLGSSPSIQRSWIAVSLFMIARLLGWRTTALSALGAGLIVELLCNPNIASNLGFQLSFLITGSILLFYRPSEALIAMCFTQKTADEFEALSLFEKVMCTVSCYLRKSLALGLAIYSTLAAASFLYFSAFSLTGFLYNLLYTPLISLSMILLYITLPIDLVLHPLGKILHLWNKEYTETLLSMIASPPYTYSIYITPSSWIPWGFSIWMFLLIIFYFPLYTQTTSKVGQETGSKRRK